MIPAVHVDAVIYNYVRIMIRARVCNYNNPIMIIYQCMYVEKSRDAM